MNYLELAHRLVQAGEAFVLATVVSYQPPASARPGAKALIRSDGTLEGWIGGSCAQPVVIKEALAALRDGRARLVRLSPDGLNGEYRRAEVAEYQMTCHSGGTLEIFVEPVVPAPELWLVGDTPVARALGALGATLGYRVVAVGDADLAGATGGPAATTRERLRPSRRACVVVATMGTADEDVLEAALTGEAPYVALVASPKRAAVIRQYLSERGVAPEQLAKLKAPAGLDLGAERPEEIALSILAEIVQVRARAARASAPADASGHAITPGPAEVTPQTEAIDPVCGMTVLIATARFATEYAGTTFYFCCPRCRSAFEAEPQPYVAAAV